MKKKDVVGLFDVTGKVAIITGATGAFGSVAAKALAAAGVTVMLTGRNVSKIEQITKEIREGGWEAASSAGDPASLDDVIRLVKATVDTFGGIDILITATELTPQEI